MIESVNDEDAIMIVVDRDPAWIVIAILAERGHEREALIIVTREYLHSMIAGI